MTSWSERGGWGGRAGTPGFPGTGDGGVIYTVSVA